MMRAAILGLMLVAPGMAGAQNAPDRSTLTEMRLCRFEGGSTQSAAIELAGGAVRTAIFRDRSGATDVFDFTPTPNSPGRSTEMFSWRQSGLPGKAQSRLQMAHAMANNVIVIEVWLHTEGEAPTFSRSTLNCAPPR